MCKKIIDVSHHNGVIDWEKLKNQIDGAILSVGYGSDMESQDDKQFKRNADECTKLGIPFGVYIYSYATNDDMAKSEAEHVLRLVEGYKLDYPIFYDLEESGTESFAVSNANVFGDIIQSNGYWCGIYANQNWWSNYLVEMDRFTKWIASYSYKPTQDCDMWQYSSQDKFDGISGDVDSSECYRDYPTEINSDNSNDNCDECQENDSLKSTDEIAQEVIDGQWGDGDDRANNLNNAGYDYDTIQSRVNEMLDTDSQPQKSIDEIADEVIAGGWGDGNDRQTNLENAGYDYQAVQDAVNEKLGCTTEPQKSIDDIANEVIRGEWGDNPERQQRLEDAGYDYDVIQNRVNELM